MKSAFSVSLCEALTVLEIKMDSHSVFPHNLLNDKIINALKQTLCYNTKVFFFK